MDFIEQLKIDDNDLNTVCKMQPVLFAEWAKLSVEAADERERGKLLVEQTYANIDKEIRRIASESGIKLTEKQIESQIITNEDYIRVQKEYLEKSKNAAILQIAKQAFEQRKSMIEMICRLRINESYQTDIPNTMSRDELRRVILDVLMSNFGKL